MDDIVQCAWNVRAKLGEGPIYDPTTDALYFVDIKGMRLHRLVLASGAREVWDMPDLIGWVAPRASGNGLVAGLRSGFAFLQLDPLTIRPIGAPEADRINNRLNDAKVDAHGRIWAGSMDDTESEASGALYRLDASLRWVRVDDGYGVANGPTFSPDGKTLYHADSAKRVVYQFNLAADGTLANRRAFVTFNDDWGYPDGMTTDVEGGVWIAHWDGARISRFTPDGRLDRSIALPVSRPTSCAFAGAHMERMFVTSASVGRAEEPLAGALFEVQSGTRGAPVHPFAG